MKKYVGYKEMSEMTGIPTGTLYAFVSRKEIPHLRMGPRHVKFSVEEVMAWIESHRVPMEKEKKKTPRA